MLALRTDHAIRTLEFAQDILRIVKHLYRERRVKIRVQIGIDSGPAAGGLVGRTRFTYLLSGETMSIAGLLARQCPPNSVLVGSETHEAAKTVFPFGPATQVFPDGGGSPLAAWELKVETKPSTGEQTFQAQGAARV